MLPFVVPLKGLVNRLETVAGAARRPGNGNESVNIRTTESEPWVDEERPILVRAELARIQAHKLFRKSQVVQRLLSFLVDAECGPGCFYPGEDWPCSVRRRRVSSVRELVCPREHVAASAATQRLLPGKHCQPRSISSAAGLVPATTCRIQSFPGALAARFRPSQTAGHIPVCGRTGSCP